MVQTVGIFLIFLIATMQVSNASINENWKTLKLGEKYKTLEFTVSEVSQSVHQ